MREQIPSYIAGLEAEYQRYRAAGKTPVDTGCREAIKVIITDDSN